MLSEGELQKERYTPDMGAWRAAWVRAMGEAGKPLPFEERLARLEGLAGGEGR
jgi:hypothetical protein